MTILKRSCTRLLNFVTKRHGSARLREEIEAHLAAQTEENIRAGMAPGEAARQARLKFGAVEAVRADYHAEASLPFLEDLLRDGRYALRVLWKSPAFALVAVVSLMLGIGTNIVVFGVVNAVLLHPLEVSDPPGLYQVRQQAWAKGRLLTTSYPALRDFQQRNTAFSGMAGYNGYSSARLSWQHAVRNVSGVETTGNYFDVLGVQPQAGRFFHAADEHGPGSAPYVVLSDGLWRNEFQADRGVIGTTVQLDKALFTVIGVAPARFHGTEQFVWPDYWIPMVNEVPLEGWDYLSNRDAVAVTMLGRLKPGATPRQATENLNAIAVELAREYPQTDKGLSLRLIHPGLYGDNGDVIRGFLCSVSVLAVLVLAAACANLASLFAARAADRRRELAIRAALGAGRGRLLRQLLTEAAVVSLLGGAAGLWAAGLLLGMLNRWQSSYGHLAVGVDARGVPIRADLDRGQRAALRNGAGAASVAERPVAGDEKWVGGRHVPARFRLAGPVARRTDRHLHAAGHGFAGGGAWHGASAARPNGLPSARRVAGRDGPEPDGAGWQRGVPERASDA